MMGLVLYNLLGDVVFKTVIDFLVGSSSALSFGSWSAS
jgi:hypothetical protein